MVGVNPRITRLDMPVIEIPLLDFNAARNLPSATAFCNKDIKPSLLIPLFTLTT